MITLIIIHPILTAVDDIVWGPLMMLLLIGTGIFLTFRLRGLQARKLVYALRLIIKHKEEGKGDISPFRALMTTLSGTIGTGNIAGVATAISLGGPGALFWMWLTAIVGMATKFVECTLALHFREELPDGTMIGGPFYYLERGLKHPRLGLALGMAFATFGIFSSFGIGNMTQANSVSLALNETFHIPGIATGLLLALLVALVVIGGIKRLGHVAGDLVPFMASFYISAAMVVLILNFEEVPGAFLLIIESALSGQAAVGGFAGATVAHAMRFGIARGVFSNEAGLGSAPMAHATAKTPHSIRQGLIAMLGPFVDTIVVCSMTGLVIVSTGAWETGKTSTSLSIHAFNSQIGYAGDLVITFGMVLFAFTTILTWSFYGKQCLSYFVKKVSEDVRFYRFFLRVYYSVFLVGIVIGAGVVDLPNAAIYLVDIWLFSDITNALMAIPNLIGLLFLSKIVVNLFKDYFKS
ncbi:MAG TPA: sodium:alanine symporter family protein [Candidatus Bathyarchaeia archaeon]|nr:sodium:alanine symporter family protein [Candidatus Bathyarchaeia archaeon]